MYPQIRIKRRAASDEARAAYGTDAMEANLSRPHTNNASQCSAEAGQSTELTTSPDWSRQVAKTRVRGGRKERQVGRLRRAVETGCAETTGRKRTKVVLRSKRTRR